MKFVSFNINGIRAHFHQLITLINIHRPDVIGLQETKVNDSLFPLKKIKKLGYYAYFYGNKNHYGVAFLTKKKPILVYYGFSNDDYESIQYRLITIKLTTEIGIVTVMNGYFPQGNNRNNAVKFMIKKIFFSKLEQFIRKNFTSNDFLLIMGDINIAPTDFDIGIGEKKILWLKNGICSFLPEERIWINELLNLGFIDSWRFMHKKIKNKFSWFDYRLNSFYFNRGLRLDVIFPSKSLMNFCVETGIDYHIRRMERPSDHAPVWATFSFQ